MYIRDYVDGHDLSKDDPPRIVERYRTLKRMRNEMVALRGPNATGVGLINRTLQKLLSMMAEEERKMVEDDK